MTYSINWPITVCSVPFRKLLPPASTRYAYVRRAVKLRRDFAVFTVIFFELD